MGPTTRSSPNGERAFTRSQSPKDASSKSGKESQATKAVTAKVATATTAQISGRPPKPPKTNAPKSKAAPPKAAPSKAAPPKATAGTRTPAVANVTKSKTPVPARSTVQTPSSLGSNSDASSVHHTLSVLKRQAENAPDSSNVATAKKTRADSSNVATAKKTRARFTQDNNATFVKICQANARKNSNMMIFTEISAEMKRQLPHLNADPSRLRTKLQGFADKQGPTGGSKAPTYIVIAKSLMNENASAAGAFGEVTSNGVQAQISNEEMGIDEEDDLDVQDDDESVEYTGTLKDIGTEDSDDKEDERSSDRLLKADDKYDGSDNEEVTEVSPVASLKRPSGPEESASATSAQVSGKDKKGKAFVAKRSKKTLYTPPSSEGKKIAASMDDANKMEAVRLDFDQADAKDRTAIMLAGIKSQQTTQQEKNAIALAALQQRKEDREAMTTFGQNCLQVIAGGFQAWMHGQGMRSQGTTYNNTAAFPTAAASMHYSGSNSAAFPTAGFPGSNSAAFPTAGAASMPFSSGGHATFDQGIGFTAAASGEQPSMQGGNVQDLYGNPTTAGSTFPSHFNTTGSTSLQGTNDMLPTSLSSAPDSAYGTTSLESADDGEGLDGPSGKPSAGV